MDRTRRGAGKRAGRAQPAETLRAQRDLALGLLAASSLEEAMWLCLDAALAISGLDSGGIYLVERESGDLRLACARGVSPGFLAEVSLVERGSPRWERVMAGRPLHRSARADGAAFGESNLREGLQACSAIPVVHRGQVIACFNIASHTLEEIPAAGRDALEAMAAQVGGAIARIEAETAVRQSQAELQALVDSVQDFVFVLDSEGGVLLANRLATERLGYDKAELLGRNAADFHPPARREEAVAAAEAVLAGQRPSYTTLVVARDGAEIPVETKLTLGRWGDREVVFGISRDITDRLRAEQRQRAVIEGLRAVLAAADELLACPDLDCVLRRAVELGREVIGFERCGIYLCDGDGLRGAYGTDTDLRTTDEREIRFPPGHAAWLRQALRQAVETGRWVPLDGALTELRDGRVVEVGRGWHVATPIGAADRQFGVMYNDTAVSGGPLNETLQEIGAVYCSLLGTIIEGKRAEEERRRLEARVARAQKLESLEVLAGSVAHDFNNLLVGVIGNAALAATKTPADSSAHRHLQQIRVAATRASELARQMLAYSGRAPFVVQPCDLSALVNEMAELLASSISEEAVLRRELAEDLPPVKGDATQLRQVVMNLILNASDALGEAGGMITLATGTVEADRAYLAEAYLDEGLPEGRYVYLEVSDTGSGMSEEIRARIFDPFFTTKEVGRGLGLAVVLGMVRGHRGAVRVRSRPGRGATFTVLLPAATEALPVEEKAPPPPPARLQCEGTVVVADDEALVRAVAKATLEEAGLRVLTARDGAEAVRLVRERGKGIAAVVLDLTMPGMGGEEAFEEIRALRPELPVILSTGYSEQEALSRFADRKPAGLIEKPYDPAALAAAVARALGG